MSGRFSLHSVIIFPSLFCLAAVIVLSAGSSCRHETDLAAKSKWADARYKADYISRHRKARYSIQNSSASPKAAVQRLLDAFCAEEGNPGGWLFNETEHRQILWPNLPEADRPGPYANPDAYWKLVASLRAVVWKRMVTYRGRCVAVQRIDYRRDPVYHYSLQLHYPGKVYVKDLKTGETFFIEYIRSIIEHSGRFKVAQIAPE